jgi:hypothetical protein
MLKTIAVQHEFSDDNWDVKKIPISKKCTLHEICFEFNNSLTADGNQRVMCIRRASEAPANSGASTYPGNILKETQTLTVLGAAGAVIDKTKHTFDMQDQELDIPPEFNLYSVVYSNTEAATEYVKTTIKYSV